MQKLGYQKPCWDQAILSSLVNKQVDTDSGHSVNQLQEDEAQGKQTLHVLTRPLVKSTLLKLCSHIHNLKQLLRCGGDSKTFFEGYDLTI